MIYGHSSCSCIQRVWVTNMFESRTTFYIDCYSNHLSQWQMTAQMSKSLRSDIMWEFHKRTRQEVSAKLESYIYKILMVHATNN